MGGRAAYSKALRDGLNNILLKIECIPIHLTCFDPLTPCPLSVFHKPEVGCHDQAAVLWQITAGDCLFSGFDDHSVCKILFIDRTDEVGFCVLVKDSARGLGQVICGKPGYSAHYRGAFQSRLPVFIHRVPQVGYQAASDNFYAHNISIITRCHCMTTPLSSHSLPYSTTAANASSTVHDSERAPEVVGIVGVVGLFPVV